MSKCRPSFQARNDENASKLHRDVHALREGLSSHTNVMKRQMAEIKSLQCEVSSLRKANSSLKAEVKELNHQTLEEVFKMRTEISETRRDDLITEEEEKDFVTRGELEGLERMFKQDLELTNDRVDALKAESDGVKDNVEGLNSAVEDCDKGMKEIRISVQRESKNVHGRLNALNEDSKQIKNMLSRTKKLVDGTTTSIVELRQNNQNNQNKTSLNLKRMYLILQVLYVTWWQTTVQDDIFLQCSGTVSRRNY